MRYQLKTIVGVALGAGDREPGTVLASFDFNGPVVELIQSALTVTRLSQLNTEFDIVEGVQPVEVLTALRNTHKVIVEPLGSVGETATEESYDPPSPVVDQSDDDDLADWQQIRIVDFDPDTIQTRAINALIAAGLETANDIIVFANENDGLLSIDGIGKTAENAIVEYLDSLIKENE